MPKLDLDAIPQVSRTGYPPPFDTPVQGRWYRRLAGAGGLTHMGATHVVLKPGAWSSQRHCHWGQDEFLVMLSGAAVLVDNGGEMLLGPGDCCAFPAGDGNGHHLQNRSEVDCCFVVMSAGPDRGGDYSDIDMRFDAEGNYLHKDNTPYPNSRVR